MPHSKMGARMALYSGLPRARGVQGWSSSMRSRLYPTSLSLPTTFVQRWWRSLWVCCQERAGVTKSHSHVVEWMSGSRIQSHWPWRMLWPISMFSRILARLSRLVPATQAALLRLPSSAARPVISSPRWILIIRRMYAASEAPRLASTSSLMASSSRPSSATCSSLRCAAAGGRTAGLPDSASFPGRVLELPAGVTLLGVITDIPWCSSDFEVDGSGGCRDTRLDELAWFPVDFPGPQVADLPRQERCEAAVADAHPAATGHQHPGVL